MAESELVMHSRLIFQITIPKFLVNCFVDRSAQRVRETWNFNKVKIKQKECMYDASVQRGQLAQKCGFCLILNLKA